MTLPLDITRCASQDCPRRETCARAMDLPDNARIAWLYWSDFYRPDQECRHHIPTGFGEKVEKINSIKHGIR